MLVGHALRTALLPVVTILALHVPNIFTGAIVTEQIFRVPGIGALLIGSLLSKDTPVVMAIVFSYAILAVVEFGLIFKTVREGPQALPGPDDPDPSDLPVDQTPSTTTVGRR